MKKIWSIVLLMLLFSGCTGKEQKYTHDFFAMNTYMSITAYGENVEDTVLTAVEEIRNIENKISRTIETSDVYKLNNSNGAEVGVSDITYDILEQAVQISEETNGAFDITVSAISDLWGIGTEDARIPNKSEIDNAILSVDYHNIVLMDNHKVKLLNGAKLDLGGIGKGYATDKVYEIMKAGGVDKAIIALAGNVYVIGEKSEGTPWKVGISNPEDSSQSVAAINTTNKTIVTTGDYERYFEKDGIRYHHIFDSNTGYPAKSDLQSVTIVSNNSTEADSLATAFYVMGLDKSLEFCKDRQDLAVVFITNDKRIIKVGDVDLEIMKDSIGYQYEN